jgi:Flp pilus assembly protein TadG
MSRIKSLAKLGSTLRHDSRGGTAIIIGLALPAVIGALGIALDTGLWYMEKRRLQQQADTATLGAARALQAGASVDTAKTVAMNDAKRNGYVADTSTTFTVNSPPTQGAYAGKANAVEVVITKKQTLFFSKYFMADGGAMKARSVAYQNSKLGKNLEVAMMLDVSGSMGGNSEVQGVTKLKAMQDAAKLLIDTVVSANQSPFTSRVAIAPYSSAVNVGSTYYKKVTNQNVSNGWTSVVERSGSAAFTDDIAQSNKWLGTFKSKKNTAKGDYNWIVKNYTSNVPSSSLISPLSTDKDALKGTIDDFTANGTTAGHLGVAWSWYLLSPKWSNIFTGDAAAAAYDATKTMKVAVLLSDFDMNTYYESNNNDSATQTQTLCTNMKDAGIVIYTVGYNVPQNNTTAVNLWKNCASSVNHRFSTTTVDGLVDAFKVIAESAVGGVSIISPTLVE